MMRLISQSHTFVLGRDTGLQILTENLLIIERDISITVKILKNSGTQKICCYYPKI